MNPQPSKKKNERKKYPPKRGKERDPWVKRPIPYPQDIIKSQDNGRFERFIELLKTLCLQIPLIDALKMPPYSRYMKDIVENKRSIPSEAITTMLVDYSFEGKMPEKRGDPGIPTIPCTIITMLNMLYVIWVLGLVYALLFI
jgi:hypothetical protein